MFKGFYNLTSGMLTQGRRLDVISNNMTNVSTAGYKTDQHVASTFDEAIISRIGNKDKSNPVEIGAQTYMLASSEIYTDLTQGSLEETGVPLDFALEGDGYFAIQDADGVIAYTRAGNFSLDEEGYLCLPGQGRVMDVDGNPILLMTDKIRADEFGGLYTQTNDFLGQLGVYTFADPAQLAHNGMGLFTGGGQAEAAEGVTIHWKRLERSNVSMIRQMTDMITTQRALQSAAQVTKMYDQLISKATTELARL